MMLTSIVSIKKKSPRSSIKAAGTRAWFSTSNSRKNLNREFVRFGTESRNEIAARHGLEVVRGKVPVPDLRIEYETRDGEAARVDLELLTEHYRPGQVCRQGPSRILTLCLTK